MLIQRETVEFETTTRREFRPRGAFGLEYVSRDEYRTPGGLGGIEANGRDWDGWRGDDVRTFHDMKSAAKFAKRGH